MYVYIYMYVYVYWYGYVYVYACVCFLLAVCVLYVWCRFYLARACSYVCVSKFICKNLYAYALDMDTFICIHMLMFLLS